MQIIGDKNILYLKESFSRFGKVESLDSEEITAKNIKKADVLLVRSVTKIDEELLRDSSVKFVGTVSAGIDHIDTTFLRKIGWKSCRENPVGKGITFANAAGANSNAVAEHILACLLVMAKRRGVTLYGKTIGIIGVGNVGSKVAMKSKAIGMKPLLNDPPLARISGDKKYLPLAKVIKADIVSLNVPLTYEGEDATYHMVGEKFFAEMKDNAILINTSRGDVIDDKALCFAGKKEIVLDVWTNEPNININVLKQVAIGTAHIAGYSLEGKAQATVMLYNKLCAFLKIHLSAAIGRQKVLWSPLSLLPPPNFCTVNGFESYKKLQKVTKKLRQDINYEEEVLRNVIKSIYDIESHDMELRKILVLSSAERSKYFTSLRNNYKSRREFQGTKLNNVHSKLSPSLKNVFSELGFLFSG